MVSCIGSLVVYTIHTTLKQYWCFDDENEFRCFITSTPKHMEGMGSHVETPHATLEATFNKCLLPVDINVEMRQYHLQIVWQGQNVPWKIPASQHMKVNAGLATYDLFHVEAVLSILCLEDFKGSSIWSVIQPHLKFS